MKDSRKLHPLQYLLVMIAVLTIASAKLNLAFFQHGLVGALLLAIVACTALLGDYIACVLAILLGVIALDFLTMPIGFNFSQMALSQVLEFVLASIIICVLAWRERSLKNDNGELVANAKELKAIVHVLQKDARGNDKKLAELSRINADLDELVKQFLEDDDYWENRWSKLPIKKHL